MLQQSLAEMLKKWVVNDYFTPNVKAEVILDMLLSEYIHELVEGAVLATKEMSIPMGELFGSIGPKIDYILAGDKVYLVELKTTNSSDNGKQAGRYLDACQGAFFGERLGRQLLEILRKKAVFDLELGSHESWDDYILQGAFDTILENYGIKVQEGHRAEQALKLIREQKWTQSKKYRSRKYLYTLGQLADHSGELWNKQMEVVYLTPDGICTHEGIHTESLRLFAAGLLARHPGDELAKLLSGIIKDI